MEDIINGRCGWLKYHDEEWGRLVTLNIYKTKRATLLRQLFSI